MLQQTVGLPEVLRSGLPAQKFGPLTFYANLDCGYGYEEWGAPLGRYADKPNYAIQRGSGDTHWLYSPNI